MKRFWYVLLALALVALLVMPAIAASGTTKKAEDKNKKPDPGPIRYEYYTGEIENYYPDEKDWGSLDTLTNWGPVTVTACYKKQFKTVGEEWEQRSNCLEIPPGETRVATPTVIVEYNTLYRVSFNTTSKYVAPQTVFFTSVDKTVIDIYHPGDFLKVEVYE